MRKSEEADREARHLSRSAYLAELLRQYLAQQEERDRIARYSTAYQRIPETAEEESLAEGALDFLLI
jgi:hypothetical protein